MKLSTLRTFAVAATAMCMATTATAQTVYLSTIGGTDLTRYDNKTLDVKATRQIFNGWNTICLPFSMTQSQMETLFGSDCQLEELVGIESTGSNIQLNFKACNSEGIKANKPYILHYNGVTEAKLIDVEGALIKNAQASVSFTDAFGVKVSFCGAKKQIQDEKLYGILARDNSEASFVNLTGLSSSFYATRCYISVSGNTHPTLTINHIGADEATSINAVLRNGEKADVYNINGIRISSAATASQVETLPAGVYVVKGKKVVVR